MIAKVLGIDFDNTIVCYDEIFHCVAQERGLLPPGIDKTKEAVRDTLRSIGREDDWTEMQGYVYGSRMAEVTAFAGAIDCITAAVKAGLYVVIISHKTRVPYRGQSYDLHAAAWGWLEQQGFLDPNRIGLKEEQIHFLTTKELKLKQIQACGCNWFIDDLQEFLMEATFPNKVERCLFDPAQSYQINPQMPLRTFNSWADIREYLPLS